MLQSPRVAYRGQIVAARRRRDARDGRAGGGRGCSGVRLRPGAARRRAARRPPAASTRRSRSTPASQTDSDVGDVDARAGGGRGRRRRTYTTPGRAQQPDGAARRRSALWDDGGADALRLQPGRRARRATRSRSVFELEPGQVRVIAARTSAAASARRAPRARTSCWPRWPPASSGRPVKLALTPPADVRPRRLPHADDPARAPGRRRATAGSSRVSHDVVEQTSHAREFAEQTAVADAHDVRGAEPAHRPTGWPRSTCRRRRGCARRASAPGCSRSSRRWTSSPSPPGIDPIELRIRNEPERDPESGRPCRAAQPRRLPARGRRALRLGRRDPRPGVRREGRWLVGHRRRRRRPTRPAAARRRRPRAPTPRRALRRAHRAPPTSAPARAPCSTQIAADALGVPVERVRVEIGDSALPAAPVAGGSMGTASWGSAVVERAARCERDSRTSRSRRRVEAPPTRPTRSPAHGRSLAPRASAPSSPRSASTPTPARSASRACSACSRPAGSSTPRPRARSSSAA